MFASMSGLSTRSRARLALIPVGLAAVALTATACSSSGSPSGPQNSSPSTPGSSAASNAPSTPASSAASTSSAPKTVVKVTTLNSDGAEYGVGMPVIAYFSRKPVNAKQWQADTKVTVNSKPVTAAWYFEPSSSSASTPWEAHLRPQNYWPAHASIHVTFPAGGTSLGGNLVSDGKLTSLSFSTGPANISTVNNATHTITVTSDGKVKYTYPVSLGASNTPTKRGIKVIMEKGLDIPMRGPGYYDPHVKFTQRLTYGGEYLHAAPWNCTSGGGCVGPQNNIGNANSSNGCTNLIPAEASTLYNFLRIGDVVKFPNATGPQMRLGDGYGDWNLSWSQWLTGGAVSTH